MSQVNSQLPVAIIGAGPVGLAAAAHLVQRKLPVILFEAGAGVGASLRDYSHVRLFSPWRFNVDRTAVSLLGPTGWRMPDEEHLPTAGELIDEYLEPLAEVEAIAPYLRLNARVLAVSRAGFDKVKTRGREAAPFVLRVATLGRVEEHRAQAVIDASGTWLQPNPLGAHGIPAIGETEHAALIAYGMPDILGAARGRYAGRNVLVVGSGHSAAGNLIALTTVAEEAPGTHVVWAVRGDDLRRLFGGGANDGLPARGALGMRVQQLLAEHRLEVRRGFQIKRVRVVADRLTVEPEDSSKPVIAGIDEIIVATGARPDLGITRELRLRLDPWLESTELLAPLIDPNEHSCGTVRPHGHRELAHPEIGFYAIGAKSYGRAPNFLMATGYEQARSVVAAIAGDSSAADEVQLALPQTGVCSSDLLAADEMLTTSSTSCCGGPARSNPEACCALDETTKAQGEAGCGCGDAKAEKPTDDKPVCCA